MVAAAVILSELERLATSFAPSPAVLQSLSGSISWITVLVNFDRVGAGATTSAQDAAAPAPLQFHLVIPSEHQLDSRISVLFIHAGCVSVCVYVLCSSDARDVGYPRRYSGKCLPCVSSCSVCMHEILSI